jgi:5-hydroxyisourate hydrolase
MGLSTHVLDTMHGCPAAGMPVKLYTTNLNVAVDVSGNPSSALLKTITLNADGRNPDGMLLDNHSLKVGTYRLVFDVASYFKSRNITLPEPHFLNLISIDFGIAHADQHYHVPLIVSPWSYSTYRGS